MKKVSRLYLIYLIGWSFGGSEVRTAVELVILDLIGKYPNFRIASLHWVEFCISRTSFMSISSRHLRATFFVINFKSSNNLDNLGWSSHFLIDNFPVSDFCLLSKDSGPIRIRRPMIPADFQSTF